MKEKTFRIYKYIIYALLGLSSILMIGFRRDLIDVGIGQGAFFRYFIPFIIVIGLRRILMIVDRRMSKVNYSLLQTKNEEDLIDKLTKISIADLENPDNRNLYDGCLSESSYKEKLIDSQALMIKNLIIIIGTLFILFTYNNLFAILLLALVGLLISIEAFSIRKAGDIWASYRSNMRRANYFSNVLINSKYLSERKVFATSEFFNQKFSDEFSSASQTNKALGRGRFIRDMAYDLGFIGLIIFYVLTFARPNAPGFSLGLFTSLFYQLIEVKLTVSDLILNFFSYKSAKVVENNYMKFFDLSEEKTGDKPLDTIKSIEFKDVHFTYPNSDKEVLSGISFKMDQGSYGLVGENGSGKSTITKLMMGLYEVTSGQILINGLDISSYKKSDLKDSMALVFQSSHHYPASLIENLDFKGGLKYDDGLAESLGIDEIISSLPKGKDTDLSAISKDAVSMSGGQWQRLGIMRALNRDASLYILDEPNALLDPISEAKMYGKYLEILEGKISLLISHRLGATKLMDEIIVLRKGKIYAKGSHEDLMKRPYYRDLYNTQKEMYL